MGFKDPCKKQGIEQSENRPERKIKGTPSAGMWNTIRSEVTGQVRAGAPAHGRSASFPETLLGGRDGLEVYGAREIEKKQGPRKALETQLILCLGLEQNIACVFQGKLSKASDSQNVNLRSAKSASSPVSLLEMQIQNQKLCLCLASLPGSSDGHRSLRTIAADLVPPTSTAVRYWELGWLRVCKFEGWKAAGKGFSEDGKTTD